MDTPVISSIAIFNLTKTTAHISYRTDTKCQTKIDYGTTTSYGSTSTDATLVNRHGVQLASLSAGTTYHYKITATDTNGNITATADRTFVSRLSNYVPGDVNGDGSVTLTDLSIVASNWKKTGRTLVQGNLDNDPVGLVDEIDIAIVSSNV